MKGQYLIQYARKIGCGNNNNFDRLKFKLNHIGNDSYTGRTLGLTNEEVNNKNKAILLLAKKTDNYLYLAQLNPTMKTQNEDFFSFLHIFELSENYKSESDAIIGNSFNWLTYCKEITELTKQYSFSSNKIVLDMLLTTINQSKVKEILSNDNLQEIITRKGSHWNQGTILKHI